MAIVARHTIGSIQILEVDADPTASPPVPAPPAGSLALFSSGTFHFTGSTWETPPVSGLLTRYRNGTAAVASYETFADAFAAANATDVIVVRPGSYAEGNLTLPAGVTLAAPSGVTIAGNGANTTLSVSGDGCKLIGNFTIAAPNIASTRGLDVSGNGLLVDGLVTLVGEGTNATCAEFHGSTYTTTVNGSLLGAGTFDRCYVVDAGHSVRPSTLALSGTAQGNVGLEVVNGETRIGTLAFRLAAGGSVDTGVLISGSGCDVQTINGNVDGFNVAALRITSDNTECTLRGTMLSVAGGGGSAVLVDGAATGAGIKLHLEFCDVGRNEISVPSTFFDLADSHIIANTDEADEPKLVLEGELSVGFPERGFESNFGEGDSVTRGMLVYTFDGLTTTDVTASAKSEKGSTFTFPNTATSYIYVGWDLANGSGPLPFHGVRVLMGTVADWAGQTPPVVEYWDGSGWADVATMWALDYSPYQPYADEMFLQSGSSHIRFNPRLGTLQIPNPNAPANNTAPWDIYDPPEIGYGTDLYWIRFSVDAAAVTGAGGTLPVIQQFRMHTSRTEMAEDGWQMYYGTARSLQCLKWDIGLVQKAPTDSPSNQNIYLNDKLSVGLTENQFNNGATDRVAGMFPVPLDLDTSGPICLAFAVAPTTAAGAANATFNVYWGWSRPDDPDYNLIRFTSGANPNAIDNIQTDTVTMAIPNVAGQIVIGTCFLDVREVISKNAASLENGDWLWLALERDGGGDAFTGNLALLNFRGGYWAWNNGGHAF